MNKIISKTDLVYILNLTDDIINSDNINSVNFYSDILNMVSSVVKKSFFNNIGNFTINIFLAQNAGYILKIGYPKNKLDYKIDNKYIEELYCCSKKYLILKTKKDEVFYNNTVFLKLAIKNSIFGFITLSSDEDLTEDMAQILTKISNALSYKIKDYELNQVFKLQLNALQEAISEKDNAYEIIKKQHKKLQELDKTKNLFIANISHELRTPLNAIIGFSQALDAKIFGDLNEKQAEYIKDIQVSSLHLLGMINEILDLSKIEAHVMKFNPTIINSSQIINEVINILEPLYKNKKINLKTNLEYQNNIKADYQKFQQILFNLISNAIKFTNEKGTIEVISKKENKDYILKIKDNGIGIDKKFHSKIFKKFVHLNNIYAHGQNSTGLGLTITKELVKLHKGKITLESEINSGTTFIIKFKNMVTE